MTVEWSYVHNKGEGFCYFYTILSNGKFCVLKTLKSTPSSIQNSRMVLMISRMECSIIYAVNRAILNWVTQTSNPGFHHSSSSFFSLSFFALFTWASQRESKVKNGLRNFSLRSVTNRRLGPKRLASLFSLSLRMRIIRELAVLRLIRRHERCSRKLARYTNHLTFLTRCIKSHIIPRDLRVQLFLMLTKHLKSTKTNW